MEYCNNICHLSIAFVGGGIVDIDYCYLQSELKNNILTYIREHYKDLTEVTIRGDEEIMVSLSSDSPINPKPLFNHFEEIRSVYVNSEHQMGERLITKEINHIKFNLSLDSFFQVNTLQTEFLYKKIVEIWREYIGERNEFEFDFNGVKRCKHLHLDYTVFI